MLYRDHFPSFIVTQKATLTSIVLTVYHMTCKKYSCVKSVPKREEIHKPELLTEKEQTRGHSIEFIFSLHSTESVI